MCKDMKAVANRLRCPAVPAYYVDSGFSHAPVSFVGVGSTEAGILHRTTTIPQALSAGITDLQKETDKLFRMNPSRFEKFVGEVMSAFYACEVTHCGKSHDGGIDLLLLRSDIGFVPVQVKRRSNYEAWNLSH